MEHALVMQDATPVTVMQDETGHWFIQNPQSGHTSKELFISLEVATKAIEGNFFTWEEAD
ncbi:hypothetical protein ACFL3U_01320 [Pseudomonadota bacterium]